MDAATETHARLFWSGGMQAVRLPKAMRLPGKQVIVRRRGAAVILEPLPEADDWTGFWDRLVSLARSAAARPVRPSGARRCEAAAHRLA